MKRNKGFTMMEVLIAVAIMVVIGAVAAIILLHHIHRSHVASAMEDIHAIRTAITSAMMEGGIIDADNDGDYLDDLITQGKLDKDTPSIPGASYEVLKVLNVNGVEVYYLTITCDNEECRKIIKDLDEQIDGGDGPTTGNIQWS